MISKILMCCCYKDEFQASGNSYIKKHIHFYCKCKEKHFHYVLFCENHPFGSDLGGSTRNEIANFGGSETDEKKCSCKTGLSHEVCGFCLSARYILNFKCFKICDVKFVKQVPLHPRERLQRKRKSTLEITAV